MLMLCCFSLSLSRSCSKISRFLWLLLHIRWFGEYEPIEVRIRAIARNASLAKLNVEPRALQYPTHFLLHWSIWSSFSMFECELLSLWITTSISLWSYICVYIENLFITSLIGCSTKNVCACRQNRAYFSVVFSTKQFHPILFLQFLSDKMFVLFFIFSMAYFGFSFLFHS